MKKTNILIFLIILALVGLPAFVQKRALAAAPDDRRQEGFSPDRRSGDPPPDDRIEDIRKKIEAIRIWRLTDELRLDSVTSGKLAALLGSIDQRRREILREQMEGMRTMRQALRSQKPDEAKIKQILDRLENNQRAMEELKYTELKGVKEFLTIEQQARFVVFQQEFQREIQNMIAGAREGGPGLQGGRDRGDFRGPGPGMDQQGLGGGFRPEQDRRDFRGPAPGMDQQGAGSYRQSAPRLR